MSSELARVLVSHERWRGEQCLNLIASENVTSPKVRKILGSDLGHRYTPPDHFYKGSRFTDQVEDTARKLCCEIFCSEWADVAPLPGHVADMIGGVVSGRQDPKREKRRAVALPRRFSRIRYA